MLIVFHDINKLLLIIIQHIKYHSSPTDCRHTNADYIKMTCSVSYTHTSNCWSLYKCIMSDFTNGNIFGKFTVPNLYGERFMVVFVC